MKPATFLTGLLLGSFLSTLTATGAEPPAVAEQSPAADLFHPPVRLMSRGAFRVTPRGKQSREQEQQNTAEQTDISQDLVAIDTGEVWGHSGPCLFDVDGDGLNDLVLGDFGGKFRFYKNRGTNQQPELVPQGYLQAGGVDAEVWIYCCIGSSPHFADLDGDGIPDLLSGSYDPGEFYLFRGVGDGTFQARETLCDKLGKPILRKPHQQQNHESFGSWIATADWDNDGDLDLILGGFGGEIFLRINEGTPTQPEFATENTEILVQGEPLKTPSSHAAVAVADWDQDGLWDILAGTDSGAVYFFRNQGQLGQPAFSTPELLVAAHDGNGYDEILPSEADLVPGIRSQICVADYDGDGKPDLLLGDFCTTITPRPDLSETDRAAWQEIDAQKRVFGSQMKAKMDALREDFFQRYPGEEIHSDEANAAWSKEYRALVDGEEYQALVKEREQLDESTHKYLVKPEREGSFNDYATTRGYVWLFRRK